MTLPVEDHAVATLCLSSWLTVPCGYKLSHAPALDHRILKILRSRIFSTALTEFFLASVNLGGDEVGTKSATCDLVSPGRRISCQSSRSPSSGCSVVLVLLEQLAPINHGSGATSVGSGL